MAFDQQAMLDKLSLSRMMLNPRSLNNQSIPTRAAPISAAQPTVQPKLAMTTTSSPTAQVPTTPLAQVTNKPTTGFDPNKKGTHESFFDLNRDVKGLFTSNSGGEGGSDVFNEDAYNQYVKDRPEMAGVFDYGSQFTGGEGGSLQKTVTTNYNKLPNNGQTILKDKTGNNTLVDQVFHVTDPSQVIDPRYIKFDPNYGWITPQANRKPTNQIGLGVMNVALGGLTGLTGAGAMLALAKGGLQGISTGKFDPMSTGLSLAGAFAPGLGVPSWAIQAGKTGLSLANLNKGR